MMTARFLTLGVFLLSLLSQNISTRAKNLFSESTCVTFPNGGTDTQIPVINMCNVSKEFDVQWSGSNPPNVLKYRINPSGSRTIIRRDVTAKILSDSPSALGLGTSVNVTTQAKQLIANQTGVYIINTTTHHTYTEFVILVLRNGQLNQKLSGNTGYELDPVGTNGDGSHQPVGVFLPGQGDTYVVQSVRAETDND